MVTKGAEMVGGFQYECVIRGKWTILTCRAQKFSKLLGFVSSTFVKVGHLAWIACLDHLWVFLKVSLPDFQHRHGLLPVRPDCLIRDAVWQAPRLQVRVTCAISGDAHKSLCAGGVFLPLSTKKPQGSTRQTLVQDHQSRDWNLWPLPPGPVLFP